MRIRVLYINNKESKLYHNYNLSEDGKEISTVNVRGNPCREIFQHMDGDDELFPYDEFLSAIPSHGFHLGCRVCSIYVL